jgi:hypothetical protein
MSSTKKVCLMFSPDWVRLLLLLPNAGLQYVQCHAQPHIGHVCLRCAENQAGSKQAVSRQATSDIHCLQF